MRRVVILAMISFLLAMPAAGLKSVVAVPADDCLPFDSKCLEEQAECDYWDPLCKDDLEECPSWDLTCNDQDRENNMGGMRQYETVEYTEEVNCKLVLNDTFAGISGYCGSPIGADLNYCIVDKIDKSDEFSVGFLCSDGKPDFSAKTSRNQVSVKNLGTGGLLGKPYWILCDKGIPALGSSKKCYDSDFSDGDDWIAGCKPDSRIDDVYKRPNTLVWYVCGR